MSAALGLTVLALAMALPAVTPQAALSVQYSGNNGSLPPPYHRATEIHIDADGRGRLLRRWGYDRQDPAQQFAVDFVLSAEQQLAFVRRIEALGVWSIDWQEQAQPPVGGPVVSLRLSLGAKRIDVPAFPVASQRELAQALRAEVLALVPTQALAAKTQWEQSKGDAE